MGRFLAALFLGNTFGVTMNYTRVNGGNVEPDLSTVGRQFVLTGLGDSGTLRYFLKIRSTPSDLLSTRAETASGFANYEQPVFVEARRQVDFSYQYRYDDNFTVFLDAQNILDEETRLFVRYPEMLFLAQDHGPVFRLGCGQTFGVVVSATFR